MNYNEPLLEGIAMLDISPTMFKEATDRYKTIAKLLSDNGIKADFYPQGSFSTGTVVRPYDPDNEETYYDLDMVCMLSDMAPDNTSPAALREKVRSVFLDHGTYADMVDEYDECITLQYAHTENRPGFKLDVVMGVQPSLVSDADYSLFGVDLRWKEQDLSLAHINPDDWMGSNPHALCDWFKEKNEPFSAYDREAREANRGMYASVEEIPLNLERSALQRAVQVVKRCRDIYYSRVGAKPKVPESCALLVLVANYASSLSSATSTFEIVRGFIDSLLDSEQLVFGRIGSEISENEKSWVSNPVYPENLMKDWTNADTEAFFSWLKSFKRDLDVDVSDTAIRTSSLRNILGNAPVSKIASVSVAAPALVTSGGCKPWR